ncbi:integrase, catalytic region, zinc finger, CCHC-type containing protein [Tanacetum coccineum]|uniref:Integrase, catalytic region, zinc finger, CCHC-type containing protein n=1 Tax=Tanacetum coccineum TaxID=301880 RepID=A0ABQ4ZE36_9ASTR
MIDCLSIVETDKVNHVVETDIVKLVVEIESFGMSSDEFDKETGSSDGLQPKQADLSCVHALNKLHLHEIHVVPSKHEADQYVHVIDGQLVQDPLKRNDVESLFEQARRAGAKDGTLDQHQPSSSSKSFSGRGRLPSGETPSAAPQQQPEPEVHTITFWTNGFTEKDALRRLDDPQNASFLEVCFCHLLSISDIT